jgi:formylmethanofuran--tetrahydromethanopterin N-formyltransferase
MQIGSTQIDDTFAEGFTMRYARVIVTAHDAHWLDAGLREFCGYGSSVIGCDAEAGVERYLMEEETPDGRPGAAAMLFAFSTDDLQQVVPNRVGQSLLTCPTTAVYDGLPESEQRAPMGRHLRFFGDGFQKSKVVSGRRYWRVPVMEGEFVVEQHVGVNKGVAGGNFIIQATELEIALSAARAAVNAIGALSHVITPFPGGVARSGSKVGSKYELVASTAEAFCPTLRGRVESKLHPDANAALEIVINGATKEDVDAALVDGIRAAATAGALAISAGNYGGKLGKHHFHLRELLSA